MSDDVITHGVVDVTVLMGGRTGGSCYSLGCIPGPKPPTQWETTFGFGSPRGILGWGLHDNAGRAGGDSGIFSRGKLVAPSTKGYRSGDRVRMRIDIDRGDIEFWVNDGECPCAELRGVPEIRDHGIFPAATIVNLGAVWSIFEQQRNE
ncbi:hypothetical protein PAPYR_1652 [Paratrimastix pyriformis]|uniref:B30.2/SPRY domain-containing protein n=1 Tax=Paratrimastix pyriformis TaxID=342808 RepID=A0ABQ8US35_9EUKA|nr:hypothetical protein PAPYR_1652 [Paratrimastix pyriformis]